MLKVYAPDISSVSYVCCIQVFHVARVSRSEGSDGGTVLTPRNRAWQARGGLGALEVRRTTSNRADGACEASCRNVRALQRGRKKPVDRVGCASVRTRVSVQTSER
jgi:hypothetical protein